MLGGVGIALNDTPSVPEGAQGPQNAASNDAIARRVARLTAGQLDCLRLVDQHLSSKEIVRQALRKSLRGRTRREGGEQTAELSG